MKIVTKILENIWYILKNGLQLALFCWSVLGTYFTIVNPDRTEVGTDMRINILILGVVIGYAVYFIWILICRKVTIYEEDNKTISVQYGDLIEIIERYERSNENAIFVIPVNRCFDTVVDNIIVEDKTVHGQFINYFTHNLGKLEELDKKIEDALKEQDDFKDLDKDEKDKGKDRRYPVGTIAEIQSVKKNVFYLLALPKFKKIDNKITVDETINIHDYLECLQKMVDYYKKDGRNLPIYMPTIGCGLSRLYISIDNSVRQLLSIWRLNHEVIRDSVNIVVYKKNFWNVHIMKYKKSEK